MAKREIKVIDINSITPYEGSHNTSDVIELIKESIEKYGIQSPISVSADYVVVTGNAVYKAAKELGISEIPCVVLDDLSDDEIKQYRIADNKTSEFSRWNESKLKKELSYLLSPKELQFCFDSDLNRMLGFVAPIQIAPKPKEETNAASKEEKDRMFRARLNQIESSRDVRAPKYFTYICSKCGKEVTIK